MQILVTIMIHGFEYCFVCIDFSRKRYGTSILYIVGIPTVCYTTTYNDVVTAHNNITTVYDGVTTTYNEYVYHKTAMAFYMFAS